MSLLTGTLRVVKRAAKTVATAGPAAAPCAVVGSRSDPCYAFGAKLPAPQLAFASNSSSTRSSVVDRHRWPSIPAHMRARHIATRSRTLRREREVVNSRGQRMECSLAPPVFACFHPWGVRSFHSSVLHNVQPSTRGVLAQLSSKKVEETHFSHLLEEAPQLYGKLAALGYYRPTRIQAAAIPYLLTEKHGGLADSVEPVSNKEMGQAKLVLRRCMDILVQDLTGSGKTLAFLLPLLATVSSEVNATQAIVVVPTKELAAQIMAECRELSKRAKKTKKHKNATPLRVHKAIGQPNMETRNMLTGYPPHIVIGTYQTIDTLLNHPKYSCLNVEQLRYLVLDEVDFLLERFSRTVHTLCRNAELQQVLVSATITPYVVQSLREFLWRPKRIQTGPASVNVEKSVAQELLGSIADQTMTVAAASSPAQDTPGPSPLDMEEGAELDLAPQLSHFITTLPVHEDTKPDNEVALRWKMKLVPRMWAVLKPKAALMFVNTQGHARMYAKEWRNKGFRVGVIDGQTDKKTRDKIMTRILNRTYNMLVTTEMMSRGVDIPSLTHVFNVDFPKNPRQYLHRAGRVGRMKRVTTSNSPEFPKKRKRHRHPPKPSKLAAEEENKDGEADADVQRQLSTGEHRAALQAKSEEEARRLQDVVVSMVLPRELRHLATMTDELDLRFEMVQVRQGELNVLPYDPHSPLAELFGEVGPAVQGQADVTGRDTDTAPQGGQRVFGDDANELFAEDAPEFDEFLDGQQAYSSSAVEQEEEEEEEERQWDGEQQTETETETDGGM